GAYMWTSRKNDLYNYSVKDGPYAPQFFSDKPGSDPFSPDKFDIGPVTDANGNHTFSVQKFYQNYGLPTDHSIGLSTLKAGYLMLDYAIVPALRFSGGLRIEQANIHTDVAQFDSLGLPRDDLRRFVQDYGIVNAGNLNQTSVLPSAGLIYKVRNDELSPILVRVNFSQTVARPSMRELSGVAAYDYELRDMVNGNPDLKMVQINNYDVRFESYFKSGDNVSLSVFYKDFKNHIELVQFDPYGFFWMNNTNKSWLRGIELEGRKALLNHFEVRANVSLVDSRTTFVKQFTLTNGTKEFGETVTHTMYGQAPWVFNGIFAYTLDSIGFSAALSYNIQGPKLVIEGGAGLPAVYERSRNLLDLTLSKTLGRHFIITGKVRNLLNAATVRSYKFDQGYMLDYDRYSYGTTYVLSLTYRI
ncbi:MAG TPA: TonB-dependent receptor, partial [Ktedonobacteraceae bacterium]|nr:TonB-dependent receptor [Ktedonobacteraceae bacterium]